jgi:flagellar motor switch protein FliN/FliY
MAGEAVDLLVNGKVIARGEVIVIDEEFGLRVTEVATPRGTAAVAVVDDAAADLPQAA